MIDLKTLTIRVEDELHKKLKYKMIEDETTIQDYILNLIKKNLEETEKKTKK